MQSLKAQVQEQSQDPASLLAPSTPASLNNSNYLASDHDQTTPFALGLDATSTTEPFIVTDDFWSVDVNSYLPAENAPPAFSDIWAGDYISDSLTPEDTISSSPTNIPAVHFTALSKERAPAEFVDYLVTTPGLSVIRAHAEIFDRLVGPSYDLDIFNPASISPISQGLEVKVDQLLTHYKPTPLQRSVKHHPIIDVLPWPSFRDRFLYVMSLQKERRPKIARQDMSAVTLELMLAVKDAGGGIRVWDHNSFCPDSWEIGQVFYSKFWWAIDEEIVRASNKHRLLRGESKLNPNLLSS